MILSAENCLIINTVVMQDFTLRISFQIPTNTLCIVAIVVKVFSSLDN